MKRTKNLNNLALKTETVRTLTGDELASVAGGASQAVRETGKACNVGGGNNATSGSITSEFGGFQFSNIAQGGGG